MVAQEQRHQRLRSRTLLQTSQIKESLLCSLVHAVSPCANPYLIHKDALTSVYPVLEAACPPRACDSHVKHLHTKRLKMMRFDG